MTLLDASRAARERRLAGDEIKGEVGFNFGQHAGDYVAPETARELDGDGSDSDNRSDHNTSSDSHGNGHGADRADRANRSDDGTGGHRGERDGGEGGPDSASESGGKHHKPEEETSQWFTPDWDESSRRKNPYVRDAEKPRDDEV